MNDKKFNGKDPLNYLMEDMGVRLSEIEDLERTAGVEHSDPNALQIIAEAIQRIDKAGKDWRTGEAKVHIEAISMDLDQFHHFNKKGQITGVYDVKIFEDICSKENIFILSGIPYFYRNGVFKIDESGAHLKTAIRKRIYPEFIKSTTIKRIYDLFLGAEELQKESAELNKQPETWINFKNGMYDAAADKWHKHSPKYYSINQIPNEYKQKSSGKGFLDSWFKEAIPDSADREMLLEFCGYCFTLDTRQQKFLILKGLGGTGKSTLLKLLESAIGVENCSNISLLEIQQRFASYGLMGKLLNSCADLEIGCLEDTSVIKKSLGEDTMRVEPKGKNAFSFKNYAKMIFSTNEFPLIKSEKTNGFFRRVLSIEMNTIPNKVDVDLFAKLLNELDYFISLCMAALNRMYNSPNKQILESENSKALVAQLWKDSDTVQAWIQDVGLDFFKETPRSELMEDYESFCFDQDRRPLTKTNVFKSLRLKGFDERKVHGTLYFYPLNVEAK